MAQDWAGFSEEELRRLKQNKGTVSLPADAESRVCEGQEAWRVGEGAWGLELQVGGQGWWGSPGGCLSLRGQRSGPAGFLSKDPFFQRLNIFL